MNDIDIDLAQKTVRDFVQAFDTTSTRLGWGNTEDGIRALGMGDDSVKIARLFYTTLLQDDGNFNNKINAIRSLTNKVCVYKEMPEGLYYVENDERNVDSDSILKYFSTAYAKHIETENNLHNMFEYVNKEQTPSTKKKHSP